MCGLCHACVEMLGRPSALAFVAVGLLRTCLLLVHLLCASQALTHLILQCHCVSQADEPRNQNFNVADFAEWPVWTTGEVASPNHMRAWLVCMLQQLEPWATMLEIDSPGADAPELVWEVIPSRRMWPEGARYVIRIPDQAVRVYCRAHDASDSVSP